MEFAVENAQQAALERQQRDTKGSTLTSVDGTAGKELASLLALDGAPQRIECYDISHTQGNVAVGSRVVFIDGKPAKHLYRKFNIRTVDGVNDYASLEEVLWRRFCRVWVNGVGGTVDKDDPWSLPDLIVIDGGPGQLGAAIKGMAKAGIFPRHKGTSLDLQNIESNDAIIEEVAFEDGTLRDSQGRRTFVHICALAKNQEKVFVHGSNKPISESPDSPALLLLRSLRDESHKFALNAHRKRRSSTNGLRRSSRRLKNNQVESLPR
jgi:excinuclease ABC subunit C